MAQLQNGTKLAVLIGILALYSVAASAEKTFCNEKEESKAPCMCCKMRCWYNVQQQAKSALGHMPGTGHEGEVEDALATMSECAASMCLEICASAPKRRLLLNALGALPGTK